MLSDQWKQKFTCKALDEYIDEVSKKVQGDKWLLCNHGLSVYEKEEQLDAYLAAYGKLHTKKMFWALESFSFNDLTGKNFEIIDWGCGQGIASIVFSQRLLQEKMWEGLQKVTLVDPSEVAVKRAKNLLDPFLGYKIPVVVRNEYLPSIDEQFENEVKSCFSSERIVVHLMSNILDIRNINYVELAKICSGSKGIHYFVCVGPLRYSPYCLDNFMSIFKRVRRVDSGENNNLYFNNGIYWGGKFRIFRVDTEQDDAIKSIHYLPYNYCASFEFDAFPLSDNDRLGFSVATKIYLDNSDISLVEKQLLFVANNIICRGLPTKASVSLERYVSDKYGYTEECIENGTIVFKLKQGVKVADGDCEEIQKLGISVARLQKVFIESILGGCLKFDDEQWDVLILEQETHCGKLAIKDIEELLQNLINLGGDFKDLKLPKINVTTSDDEVIKNGYDIVIDISVDDYYVDKDVQFLSQYLKPKKEHNYFYVRNSDEDIKNPRLHFEQRIKYAPCVTKDSEGNYHDIEEIAQPLTYILQLIMRKQGFRPGQLPILSRALQLENVIGLLPTGGGKSLTYQLAALLQPGVTIVVDPLNSLMVDQLEGLQKNKITCCGYVNVNHDDRDKLNAGFCLIFFVSPERMCNEGFRHSLLMMRAAGIYCAYGVIDEVHCVSEWGHDFRISYLHIGRNLKNYLPVKGNGNVSLFGLTATASFDVLSDVERELRDSFDIDPNTTVRFENTNRLELQYRVIDVEEIDDEGGWSVSNIWTEREKLRDAVIPALQNLNKYVSELQKDKSMLLIKQRYIERENINNEEQKENILNKDLVVNFEADWIKNNSVDIGGIVFCPHKSGSIGVHDSVSSFGKTPGVQSIVKKIVPEELIASFVGGDGVDEQKKFISGDAKLMVATKAFGMGIDKSNVRFTINVCHSGSLESFVQEAGRAGRDGKMALAVILYNGNVLKDKFGNVIKDNFGNEMTCGEDVHNYFIDRNFKGIDYEKNVLWYFLSKYDNEEYVDQDLEYDNNGRLIEKQKFNKNGFTTFLKLLNAAKPGDKITSIIQYEKENKDYTNLRSQIKNAKIHDFDEKTLFSNENDYVAVIEKAIYRLCCLGAIEDYTKDYKEKTLKIFAVAKEGKEYYKSLGDFLKRYYSEDRVLREVEYAKTMRGENELQKCLGYLTEFIYQKIYEKRKRAIKEMERFCQLAVQSDKYWLEVNEDLKDYIYFYFNSKYAREDYAIDIKNENGDVVSEKFSLTADSERGKKFDLRILDKYMRVIDSDVVGNGSQIDNIKHLLGATRLIRRGLTESNGVIDVLNAFCLMFLGVGQSDALDDELRDSYIFGLINIYERYDGNMAFLEQFMKDFQRKLNINGRNFMDKERKEMLDDLNHAAILEIYKRKLEVHAKWLKEFQYAR